MKLTPMILGACGIALSVGGVAGAAIDTQPMQRGSDVIEEVALAATTHPGNRPAGLERGPADQYAMETPEGLVEVDELAWYGRDRRMLGSGDLDFEADDREEERLARGGYDTPEYAAYEEAWAEPEPEQVIAMRSPVNPAGYAAYEQPPLELERPAQVAMADDVVRPEDAGRGVGSSRMISVQAALAAR